MEDLFSVDNDCMVIRLTKELDHHYTEQIRQSVDNEIMDKRIRFIIMDFNNQSFMDSSGIGFIMGRYKRIKVFGGKIYVVNMGVGLDRIFNMSGLYSITTPQNNISSAFANIRQLKLESRGM